MDERAVKSHSRSLSALSTSKLALHAARALRLVPAHGDEQAALALHSARKVILVILVSLHSCYYYISNFSSFFLNYYSTPK